MDDLGAHRRRDSPVMIGENSPLALVESCDLGFVCGEAKGVFDELGDFIPVR